MTQAASIVQWILTALLIFSSLGVILVKKPVHASLSFLLTLFILAVLYLQMDAQFIAVMQVLVYAGAILVIFMFVIILFQDAHDQIDAFKPQSNALFLLATAFVFVLTLAFTGTRFLGLGLPLETPSKGFGTVESLGRTLYLDFFFPFEAVILLFLIAVVGALYIGKKVR